MGTTRHRRVVEAEQRPAVQGVVPGIELVVRGLAPGTEPAVGNHMDRVAPDIVHRGLGRLRKEVEVHTGYRGRAGPPHILPPEGLLRAAVEDDRGRR